MDWFELLVYAYVFLLVTHLIWGPYYYRFLMRLERPRFIAKDWNEVGKRLLFITYLSFIATIVFLLFPTKETLYIAFGYSVASLLLYLVMFYESDYFFIGVTDHFIMLLPFFWFFSWLKHQKLEITVYSGLSLVLLITLYFIKNDVYDL